MNEKSILIFGAGKIGRSFIGQLFGKAGYEVVFADIDQTLVDELNRRKSYPVVIKGKTEEILMIRNVRAVSVFDEEAVKEEVERTSIMAVSVGKNALEKIIPLIGEGLKLREKLAQGRSIDIIIAENMRSASEFMRSRLTEVLPRNYPLDKQVGLVETSIGKMVPIMTEIDLKEDPLIIFAEPYNTLSVDKRGFKSPIPEVPGLSPKENIKAWVDRKAFIHNMGHATAAYVGNFYHPEAVYIFEVLTDENIFRSTRETMLQAAEILISYYPEDFTKNELKEHVEDLLERFQNRALKDTIFRVGRDVPRKLGIDDRFAGIIQMAHQKGLPYDRIVRAMAYGSFFEKTDENGKKDPQDESFIQRLKEDGIRKTLINLCGFDPEKDKYLLDDIEIQYQKLKK
jgi:mannitol-1-phosphate 5-dehydrogenase